jgi:HAD superfamily hydrolase (TIGR01549 family)
MARDRGRPGDVILEAITEFIASGRSDRRPDRLIASFGLSADDPLATSLSAAFEGNGGEIVVVRDAVAVVERLAGVATVVVVSNGYPQVQAAKLRRTGLDQFVSALVASEAVGLRKPDPAIFAYASRLTGIPPTAAVHIGDSLAEDIAGANAAGYASIHLKSGELADPGLGSAVPSARVASLGELLPLLGLR